MKDDVPKAYPATTNILNLVRERGATETHVSR